MTIWHLKQACRCLKQGGILAYPTEAVYGLGCDPDNLIALQRLLQLKQRSWQKGLILIAAEIEQLQPFLQPLSTALYYKLLTNWQEGKAITWLLPAHESVSPLLRGQFSQLAVRLTQHAKARELCQLWGKPLVSTSANLKNRRPAKSCLQVRKWLGKGVDCVLAGEVGAWQNPSEIRDGLTDKIIRSS